MHNKKNWNTDKYHRWEFNNLGISIDPSYTGKDPFNFKAGSKNLHTKLKMKRTIG